MCEASALNKTVTKQQNNADTSAVVKKEDVEYQAASTRSTFEVEEHMQLLTLIAYLLPIFAYKFTNIIPLFVTGTLRIVFARAYISSHFIFVDKDNYNNKISQTQIVRERDNYAVGIVLHMWAQLFLQLLFPSMFFVSDSLLSASCWNTLFSHVFVVEPFYYAAHRWLHVPKNMKSMHGFHHSSINTLPSTSLVQDFIEHFIYIVTFGPAMLLPFFATGYQHWFAIMMYLILFDAANAYGHTNIKCNSWIWTSTFSPLHYLFYTPEFHIGHHNLFNYNFGLFMPIWDHIFGTYRDYKKPERLSLPTNQQDFIFVGHNAGLGHILTIPEFSFYSMYDTYKVSGIPIKVEFFLAHIFMKVARLFTSSYYVSRYSVGSKFIGRIVCIMRSPIDYMTPSSYDDINKDILELFRSAFKNHGTRYFGLGNLNKMMQLNDGGNKIVQMIENDPLLKDKNIRVWTGDTLTAASVFQQIIALPNLKKIFYIGGNGKIGVAVIEELAKKNIQICVYSRYAGIKHPNVSYTYDLKDMVDYDYVLIGKHVKKSLYEQVFPLVKRPLLLLDYTVPFTCVTPDALPMTEKGTITVEQWQASCTSIEESSDLSNSKCVNPLVRHVQIGVMNVTNDSFLKGYFDICMGVDQNCIYPCHMGCILNMYHKKEENEVGAIDADAMEDMWIKAAQKGIVNKDILL